MPPGGLPSFLASAFALLFLFLASALALLAALTRLNPRREDVGWMAAVSLGLGPMALSWGFVTMLRIFPGRAPGLYVVTAAAVCVGLAAVGARSSWRALGAAIGAHVRRFTGFTAFVGASFTLPLAVLLACLVLVGSFVPLWGGDALEYAQAARIVAEARSVADYPFTDSAAAGGFYGPWTHLPGYVGLLSFGYMLQGGAESAGVIRLVSAWFAFASVVGVWRFAALASPAAGPLAAFLFLSTPLYFIVVAQAHIDAMRMFTFLAAFTCLHALIRRPSAALAVIVGFAVGLSHFSHSIGILTLPILLPLHAIVSGRKVRPLLADAVLITAVGVVLVLPGWLRNLSVFGALAADETPVWAIPHIRFDEYIAVTRLLATPLEKIFNGVLRGWTEPASFGFGHTYWFLLAGAVAWAVTRWRPRAAWRDRAWQRPGPVGFSLWILAGFYGIVVLSVLLGTNAVIKNPRYVLTVQPFVCIAAAGVIAKCLGELVAFAGRRIDREASRTARRRILASLPAGALVFALLAAGVTSTRAAVERTSGYLEEFNIVRATLFEEEITKALSSARPSFHLIDRINRTTPPDAVVLIFGQTGFPFYGERRYYLRYDERMVDLFHSRSVDEAWRFVGSLGITHVLLDTEPWPTLYNSIVESLLASPDHVELLYDFDGHRLFRVKPVVTPVRRVTLRSETDACEEVRRTLGGGGDQKSGYGAVNLAATGAYRFEALVEGRGAGDARLVSTTGAHRIWAGVLHAGRRTIESQFVVPPADAAGGAPGPERERAYRLEFTSTGGAPVRVCGWSIDGLVSNAGPPPGQLEQLERQELFRRGWTVEWASEGHRYLSAGLTSDGGRPRIRMSTMGRREVVLRSPWFGSGVSEAGQTREHLREVLLREVVAAGRLDRQGQTREHLREVLLRSPWFRGASAISQDELLDDFGLLLDELLDDFGSLLDDFVFGLRPNLRLAFDARGQGELELAVDLGCPETRTVERQFAGHAALRSQTAAHQFVVRSPCWPRYVRFHVRLRHACTAERSENRRAGCGPGWPRAMERAAVVLGNWSVRLEQAGPAAAAGGDAAAADFGGDVAAVDLDEIDVPGLSGCDGGRLRNPWSACK